MNGARRGALLALAAVAAWLAACGPSPGDASLSPPRDLPTASAPQAGETAPRDAAPGEPPVTSLEESAEATDLMREIESAFRTGPRLVRMEAATEREDKEKVIGRPDAIDVWAVVDGDVDRTDVLFVFAGPTFMRGTGLLLSDPWDLPLPDDGFFYHLPSHNRFKRLPQSSLKFLVPGTCLSYEDAHGFLSTDKYIFSWADSGEGETRVFGQTRSSELAENLGFRSFVATVDPARKMVIRIEFTGLNDRLTKIYEVLEHVRMDDGWLPAAVRVEDLRNQVITEVAWTYWPLDRHPPEELYETKVYEQRLIDRLIEHLEIMMQEGSLEDVDLTPLHPTRSTG